MKTRACQEQMPVLQRMRVDSVALASRTLKHSAAISRTALVMLLMQTPRELIIGGLTGDESTIYLHPCFFRITLRSPRW